MVTEKPEFQGFMFEDYEDMTEIPAYYTGNANALSIVENPYPSAVNPSAKVLKDDLTNYSTPTSGYVQINFTDSKKFYQAAREGYSTLHVKIYASTNDIYVHMQDRHQFTSCDLYEKEGKRLLLLRNFGVEQNRSSVSWNIPENMRVTRAIADGNAFEFKSGEALPMFEHFAAIFAEE
jgi:hypothetical protein